MLTAQTRLKQQWCIGSHLLLGASCKWNRITGFQAEGAEGVLGGTKWLLSNFEKLEDDLSKGKYEF